MATIRRVTLRVWVKHTCHASINVYVARRVRSQTGTATIGYSDLRVQQNRLILDFRFDLGHGLAKLLGLRFEYV